MRRTASGRISKPTAKASQLLAKDGTTGKSSFAYKIASVHGSSNRIALISSPLAKGSAPTASHPLPTFLSPVPEDGTDSLIDNVPTDVQIQLKAEDVRNDPLTANLATWEPSLGRPGDQNDVDMASNAAQTWEDRLAQRPKNTQKGYARGRAAWHVGLKTLSLPMHGQY